MVPRGGIEPPTPTYGEIIDILLLFNELFMRIIFIGLQMVDLYPPILSPFVTNSLHDSPLDHIRPTRGQAVPNSGPVVGSYSGFLPTPDLFRAQPHEMARRRLLMTSGDEAREAQTAPAQTREHPRTQAQAPLQSP